MTQSAYELFLHESRSIPVEAVFVNGENPYDRLLYLRKTPEANSGRVSF
jgi:hypothetical protein